MTPFFSIVIPAYNVELYLQETLDSVYAQTFDKYEIIVVDDGSTDGTPEMLARQNDPRLRVIRQQNAGVSAARNTGIAAAQGTFIAFLDGDDIWAPWHLEHACHFFEEHPEVHWYASPFLRSDCVKESLAGLEPDPGYDVVDYFSGNAWVCSSTAILAKKAIPGKELFPTDMAYGEDVLAWLSFALQSPLIGMGRKADCIYRFHASSAVATRAADINTEIVSSRGLYEKWNALYEEGRLDQALSFCRKHLVGKWIRSIYLNNGREWSPHLRELHSRLGWPCRSWTTAYHLLSEGLSFIFSLPLCLHFWLKGNRVPPPEENAAQKQHSAVPGQRWEIQPPENGAPLFSVVIPAYNVQEYIGDTLQSVFCQTCADFEIIVVEDGSTDDTARILAELKDPRLRVIRQKNKGVSAARNAGFAVARGKYIAMLDSDDLWKPWHLELARRFFISHPEVCWHSSKCEIVEKIPGDYLSSAMPEDTHSSAIHFFKDRRIRYMSSSNLCIRRKTIKELPFFPESMEYSEDTSAFIRFALTHLDYGVSHVESAFYRRRPGSATARVVPNARKCLESDWEIFHQYAMMSRECPMTPEAVRSMRSSILSKWMYQILRNSPACWLPTLKPTRPLMGIAPYLWVRLYIAASNMTANIFALPYLLKNGRPS